MSFTVVEKPIPDRPAARGVPDPRVLGLWLEGQRKAAEAPPVKTPARQPTPAEVIAGIRASMGWPNLDLAGAAVTSESVTLQGREGPIPALLSRPARSTGALPGIVFFHGGGFMGGKPEAVQNQCRLLAERAHAVVVNVGYRLAPEHPFPAGLNDAIDAVKAAHARAAEWGIDTRRVFVGGDSAGGNLSAACAVLDHQAGSHLIAAQLLVYPMVDGRDEAAGHLPWSLDAYEFAEHPELLRAAVLGLRDGGAWFMGLYLGSQTAAQPLVSPILYDPAAFPPTLVLTAEFDFLREEGEEFARRLAAAGVQVRAVRYRGQEHAFFDKLGLFPQTADAIDEMAAFVRVFLRM